MTTTYSVDHDGTTTPLRRVRCRNEDQELQRLLESNYDLLPGDQIDPEEPRRWLLIKREMPVPDPSTGGNRWSIDFLFVDQSATPTFVECKRFEDTRARREVMGQMLEYAANGHHYWQKDEIRAFATAAATARGESIEDAIARLRPTDDLEVDAFFERVEENLRESQLRLVFFLEEAPPELRSVVDFLNKQMERSDILIVEARLHELPDGRRVLTPSVFGYTEQARMAKRTVEISSTASRRKWDRESFLADVAKRVTAEARDAIESVLSTAIAAECDICWGAGMALGSFSVKIPDLAQRSLVTVFSEGTLSLNFGWLNESETARAARDRLKDLVVERMKIAPTAKYTEHLQQLPVNRWLPRATELAQIIKEMAESR